MLAAAEEHIRRGGLALPAKNSRFPRNLSLFVPAEDFFEPQNPFRVRMSQSKRQKQYRQAEAGSVQQDLEFVVQVPLK